MLADVSHILRLPQARPLDRPKTLSTPAFDLTFAIVTVLAIAGLFLDIWSHVTYGADQSIFSEYHLLFYSATAMAGLLLEYVALTNLRAGARWWDALPIGYGLSLIGIVFFGIDGAIDLTSHAIWGFEVGQEALNSPTHIGLFAGIALFASGPIRAEVARQRRGESMALFRLVPFVLSVVATLSAISFSTFLNLPMVAKPWALQIARTNEGGVVGVFAVLIETAILMGVLLWIVQRVTLPPGSITLIFGLYCLATMIVTQVPIFLPIWLIAGVLGDVAMVALKPSSGNVWRLRVFGAVVPLVMWSVYYAFFFVTGIGGGVWFTGYIWTGSIVQAGIVGFLLAFLLTSAGREDAVNEPGLSLGDRSPVARTNVVREA